MQISAALDVAKERVALWRKDPHAFCVDVFPAADTCRTPRGCVCGDNKALTGCEQPTAEQLEILWSIELNSQTVTKAHRGWGKSRTAGYAAWRFFVCNPNSLVMTLAPVWAQSVESIWTEIRHLWTHSKLPQMFPDCRVLTTEVYMHPAFPKWRMLSAVASDVSNIEGRHAARGQPTLAIADESKNIDDAFRYSLEGMLATSSSRFFGIGTPGIPMGWFYEAFTRQREYYKHFTFSAATSRDPAVRAKAAQMAAVMGEDDPFYRQQWLAEFAGADEGSVITLSLLESAITRKLEWNPNWRRVMSLDPAGRGAAHSVLSYLMGPVLMQQEGWQGWDILRSERRVIDAVLDWHPDVVVIDETGIGSGTVGHVRDGVRRTGVQVIGYVSQAAARNAQRFSNRKSEDIFDLRDRLRSATLEMQEIRGELLRVTSKLRDPEQVARATRDADDKLKKSVVAVSIPNEPKLLGQLASWTVDPQSRLVHVIDPEPSPDYADSALMGFSGDRIIAPMKGHRGASSLIG